MPNRFAHVWATRPPQGGEGSGGGGGGEGERRHAAAGARAEARLRRMEGLAALTVEDAAVFPAIVCAFYDGRYGVGWCERRHAGARRFWVSSTAAFLSQW